MSPRGGAFFVLRTRVKSRPLRDLGIGVETTAPREPTKIAPQDRRPPTAPLSPHNIYITDPPPCPTNIRVFPSPSWEITITTGGRTVNTNTANWPSVTMRVPGLWGMIPSIRRIWCCTNAPRITSIRGPTEAGVRTAGAGVAGDGPPRNPGGRVPRSRHRPRTG